jgi:hypothetical protein
MNATKKVKPLSEARDADARHTVAALKRAAQNARLLAVQTHTKLVISTKESTQLTYLLPNVLFKE